MTPLVIPTELTVFGEVVKLRKRGGERHGKHGPILVEARISLGIRAAVKLHLRGIWVNEAYAKSFDVAAERAEKKLLKAIAKRRPEMVRTLAEMDDVLRVAT